MRNYSRVARFWGYVFLIVGIFFAVTPSGVTVFLTSLARIAGFTGDLYDPGKSLWHVLSLSLMVAVTTSAFYSAAYPENRPVYKTLVFAKWMSTFGFLFLARQNSAWIICALGDGFVALSLMCVRAFDLRSSLSMPVACVGKKFYEVYFGKIHLAENKFFWFRHTRRFGKTNP